jgi:hypothetical protein
VTDLETEYQARGRQEKSHCKLAKARRKLVSVQKREKRIWRDLKKLWRKRDDRQRKANKLQDELLSPDSVLAPI